MYYPLLQDNLWIKLRQVLHGPCNIPKKNLKPYMPLIYNGQSKYLDSWWKVSHVKKSQTVCTVLKNVFEKVFDDDFNEVLLSKTCKNLYFRCV